MSGFLIHPAHSQSQHFLQGVAIIIVFVIIIGILFLFHINKSIRHGVTEFWKLLGCCFQNSSMNIHCYLKYQIYENGCLQPMTLGNAGLNTIKHGAPLWLPEPLICLQCESQRDSTQSFLNLLDPKPIFHGVSHNPWRNPQFLKKIMEDNSMMAKEEPNFSQVLSQLGVEPGLKPGSPGSCSRMLCLKLTACSVLRFCRKNSWAK